MDISNAIIAKSDQLNAVDLMSGPRVVTVVEVREGNAEQPVVVITKEFGPARPFKPSKTVLRVLASAWGKDTTVWVGRQMELYRDPTVRWAGEEVGGIRIKALSHIDKAAVFNLPTSKGKHAKSTIVPLNATNAEAPSVSVEDAEWVDLLNAADTLEDLQRTWAGATAAGVTKNQTIIDAKDARKKVLAS